MALPPTADRFAGAASRARVAVGKRIKANKRALMTALPE
jgi:hypothetical protein